MRGVFLGLSIGIFCANFGFLAAYTFLPLYALRIGSSMGEVGLLLASYAVVSTIMVMVLGRLSDVGGLRRVLIILGFAASAVVYWLLGSSNVYIQLLLLCGILGVTDSAYRPTAVAVIVEITPQSKVGRSIGFFSAFMAAGMASGCLFGGRIADLFGLQAAFKTASIVLAVGTLSSLVILKSTGRRASAAPTQGAGRTKGLAVSRLQFLVTSGLLLLCLDVFLRNSGFRVVTTFLPIYLSELGAENTLTGSIIAVNFASQVAFMPTMGWLSDVVGRKRVMSIGMLATLMATFLLSIVRSPFEVIPIQVAVGFSWAAITVSSNAFAADVAPSGMLGEMMGTVFTSMNLGGVGMPIVEGAISDKFDLRTTFQILSLFPLAALILSLMLQRRTRENKKERALEVDQNKN